MDMGRNVMGKPSAGQRGGAYCAAGRRRVNTGRAFPELRGRDVVNKFTCPTGPRRAALTDSSFWRPSEMRFYGIALLAGAAVLGACGGENKSATDTAAANAAATSTPAPSTATATTPSTTTTPAAGAAAAAPATGTTHEVKMIGDATGYKFEPANITIKSGDAIKFIMVTGGPHNVAFTGVTDAAVKAQLDANMPGQHMGELSGPML